MSSERFLDKLRSFFGYRPEPPRNDFRNPIWGSDDDDDGDELFSREQNIEIHTDMAMHRELARHMHELFSTFGGMFGDLKTFFNDDIHSFFSDEQPFDYADMPQNSTDPDGVNSNKIRDYYLKPGFHLKNPQEHKDVDLDGKISSQDLSGLFKKQQEDSSTNTLMPFEGIFVPGRNFSRTVITTCVTKPDGTVETRRIVKSGNEVIEETTTSSPPEGRGPVNPDQSKS